MLGSMPASDPEPEPEGCGEPSRVPHRGLLRGCCCWRERERERGEPEDRLGSDFHYLHDATCASRRDL